MWENIPWINARREIVTKLMGVDMFPTGNQVVKPTPRRQVVNRTIGTQTGTDESLDESLQCQKSVKYMFRVRQGNDAPMMHPSIFQTFSTEMHVENGEHCKESFFWNRLMMSYRFGLVFRSTRLCPIQCGWPLSRWVCGCSRALHWGYIQSQTTSVSGRGMSTSPARLPFILSPEGRSSGWWSRQVPLFSSLRSEAISPQKR